MAGYTKGQLTMALASQLNEEAGIDAATSMNIAMDVLQAGKVPSDWRARLGDKVSDAIDADLRDPKTWRADQ